MTDTVDGKLRSTIMKKVRSKNTKPELKFRKLIYRNGFRYRLHDKNLPGSPDLTISKLQLAIFINGCFWHVHEGCKHVRIPASNINYWQSKLAKNVERDQNSYHALFKLGWRVFIIWECELRQEENLILEKFKSIL